MRYNAAMYAGSGKVERYRNDVIMTLVIFLSSAAGLQPAVQVGELPDGGHTDSRQNLITPGGAC